MKPVPAVSVALLALLYLATPRLLFAADPVIHVQWDGGGTPEEGTNYRLRTDLPASPAFPDVELITGHLDWRIWSTDSVTGEPSDIGVISSPHAANYALTIADQSNGFGARNVNGIELQPTSASNYSLLNGGSIVGGRVAQVQPYRTWGHDSSS